MPRAVGTDLLKQRSITQRSDTNNELKFKVEEQEGIPVAEQRLVFGGKQLMDDRTVKDCDIHDQSVVFLVLAVKGACTPIFWSPHLLFVTALLV